MVRKSKSEIGKVFPLRSDDFITIPFIDISVHAGDPNGVGDIEYEYISVNSHGIPHPESTRGANLIGNSMESVMHSGDFIYYDESMEPNNGDIILAEVDDEYTVKYFYRDKNDRDVIWLIPENKNFKEIKIDCTKRFRVVGVVVKWESFRRREVSHVVSLHNDYFQDGPVVQKEDVKMVDNVVSFKDCIIDKSKADDILFKLHFLIDGRKGRNVAMVIKTAIDMCLITKPSYPQVSAEFGDIGVKSVYYKYLGIEYYPHEIAFLKRSLEG